MNHRFKTLAMRFGLLLGAAVLALPAQTHAAPAQITGNDLGALVTKSLAGVHSFQVVLDSISTHASASPGGVMKSHMVIVYLHQGNHFAMSMQSTNDGKWTAVVYTGTRVCMQRSEHGSWNCNVPLSYAKGYLANLDPVKAMKESGMTMTAVSSAGTKTIQGQSCTGYTYSESMQSIHYTGHGTLWFSSATGRVVEGTAVGSLQAVPGSAAMVTTSTEVYSRWNDPSLKLPAV
jgi:hypothetical protein